jgi:predicted polyphosphate/ATP-dependent NAD kinase
VTALSALRSRRDDVTIVTAAGKMGAEAARAAGFDPEVVYDYQTNAADMAAAGFEETSAEDTRAAVRAFVDAGVDLVLFVGGDGTAVDVAKSLEEASRGGSSDEGSSDGEIEVPMLGVPAGVKIYSSVFGVTPSDAGRIAASFDRVALREVNDIDEEAYREGEVRTRLQGVVSVPVADDDIQSAKQVHSGSTAALAEGVAESVEPGVTYVLGPGSTIGDVAEELGVDASPLGVDVYRDGELLVRDGGAAEIRDALGDGNVVVVSPIGGQGFVFGRGNQQLSPAVVRRCEVEVVASRRKLDDVGVLRVDTGDSELDEELRGWMRVRVGRFERHLMKVV